MALIYVVEDDKSIQEIETFALTNVGYRVEGFLCASEFYEAIDRELPDLILMDVMLPDEDGLSIVKKLRMRRDTVTVPVIMVTAKTTELDKVKGLDIGADDYITKPFGVMELISRVKAMLRRSARPEEKEKILRLGNVVLDSEKHAVYVNDTPCELTYKEYELLKLLMTNAGIVTTPGEKITMGYYLDGMVTAVFGTHTHVQTADEKILPKGTAYISDIGMTGTKNSALGMDVSVALKRFETSLPERYKVASGEGMLNGVIYDIDDQTNKVKTITRINV